LRGIGGTLPSAIDPPDGCRFSPRCEYATDECHVGDQPPMVSVRGDADHRVSCVHFQLGGDPSVVLEGGEHVADRAGETGDAHPDGGGADGRGGDAE
jgi:peptide/nickel transport system ATP-binding protein